MSILAVVLALLAERAFPQGTALGEARGLAALVGGLKKLGAASDHAALPWLLTALAAAALAALDSVLHGALPQLVLGVAVLLLCLGPRDLADDVQRLIAARARGDIAEAQRLARALQQLPDEDAATEHPRTLLGALFIQSHERLFGVLLWFMALGPAGALAYRIASRLPALLERQSFGAGAVRSAQQLHALLAWLPVRVTAALFALAGSMDDAIAAWRRVGELQYEGPWRSHSWAVLAEVATGALAMEDEHGAVSVAPTLESALREVLRMQSRALLVLLAVFALYTSGTLV